MPSNAKVTISTVMPAMRYRDANAAIEWLCKAFGFEKHLVVPGENGTVAHAQLTFGNGMVKAAGAEIVMEVEDQDYGGRLYSCLYPEGHLWSFGTYDAWP